MPSRSEHVPTYRLHKASGQAIVTLSNGTGGRTDVYLGQHNTPESRAEYARILAEWEAAGRCWPPRVSPTLPADSLTVAALILRYWPHVQQYYRDSAGKPTSEVQNIRLALRRLRQLYGDTSAAAFDCLALQALRNSMIAERLARTRINRDIDRITRLFRWAASQKLVSAAVWHELDSVEGLRAGRSAAVEPEPVLPIAEDVVEATLPFLRPQLAAMVRLMLLSGMRSGEVVIMKPAHINTTGPVWVYTPPTHKTSYRGRSRVVLLGPKAQDVLRPFLANRPADAFLFSPRESRAAFDEERKTRRKSKVTPSQAARKPKARPKKAPSAQYSVAGLAAAVGIAVKKANRSRLCETCRRDDGETLCPDCKPRMLPHWHPHQLRHTVATRVRAAAGLDASRAVLGHGSTPMTELYAELDLSKAQEIMAQIG